MEVCRVPPRENHIFPDSVYEQVPRLSFVVQKYLPLHISAEREISFYVSIVPSSHLRPGGKVVKLATGDVPPTRPSVLSRQVLYWCLYCTKLELILNRTPTTRLARGDANLPRTHWRTPRPRIRSRSGGRTPKISLPFYTAPPIADLTAAKRKTERKGNFGVRQRFSPPKAPQGHYILMLRFLRPLRRAEARVARVCGISNVRSHFASTSHWPLTFVRVACSVLLCVRLVASVESMIFKVVCANAQANLYVPCPTTRYAAHKQKPFWETL